MTVDVEALIMTIGETAYALPEIHGFSITGENIGIELKMFRKIL